MRGSILADYPVFDNGFAENPSAQPSVALPYETAQWNLRDCTVESTRLHSGIYRLESQALSGGKLVVSGGKLPDFRVLQIYCFTKCAKSAIVLLKEG
jgi:hypothetical protein